MQSNKISPQPTASISTLVPQLNEQCSKISFTNIKLITGILNWVALQCLQRNLSLVPQFRYLRLCLLWSLNSQVPHLKLFHLHKSHLVKLSFYQYNWLVRKRSVIHTWQIYLLMIPTVLQRLSELLRWMLLPLLS